jgi:hypothetical protein
MPSNKGLGSILFHQTMTIESNTTLGYWSIMESVHTQIHRKHLKRICWHRRKTWLDYEQQLEKSKFWIVVSWIWLGIEYQSYRWLSQTSHDYQPILIWSTVWMLCFLEFDNMLLKFPFWAGWSELPSLEFEHISKGKLTEPQMQRL